MKRTQGFPLRVAGQYCAMAASLLLGSTALGQAQYTLDDFNDNTKTGWTDFTFIEGVGLPTESNGQFRFELPKAVMDQVGDGLFVASTKSSQEFEIKEGRTIEFKVDLLSGGAKDSFAVLSFIPKSSGGPSKLEGYSLAKSTTDTLLVKGINKYPIAAGGVKNENVTLVIRLTMKNGAVTLTGQVLDKDANNAVIWEQSFTDTAGADAFMGGSDLPNSGPFVGAGNFVLYLFADYDKNAAEDPYQVVYDNAQATVFDTITLDDFNDNAKTDWGDFTFIPGVGLPVEANGQFTFELPGPVMQQVNDGLFSASTKSSRDFELREGERTEFRVDLVHGGAKDSFAVLSFIPKASGGPGRLEGYSIAKSTTDTLLVKGINKYPVAAGGVKNENVTLGLSLEVKNGSVILEGTVYDKDSNNAILWRERFVDTAGEDQFVGGKDLPNTVPFLGAGNFVLYLFADFDSGAVEDPYIVVYDNAVAIAPPPAANAPPILSEVQPVEFSSFQPASTKVGFKVSDDRDIVEDKLSIQLNGTTYTKANGLTLSGTGTTRTVSLGGLEANKNYVAILSAEDAEGAKSTQTIYFDTFAAGDLTIEIEDYNFSGGSFIDNAVPTVEGGGGAENSYNDRAGVQDIDFNDTRTSPRPQNALWRTQDPVRMQHTRDNARAKFTEAGGPDAGVFDYDVGDIAAGEWLNYTRTFAAGSYEVYLRQSVVNMASGESVLEQVTGDRSQPNQTVKQLGSFLGALTGFKYRNFPLTDATGNHVILRLSGETTLRLRQLTPDTEDGGRLQTYLVFVPVADPGLQRALVSSTQPRDGEVVDTVFPAIDVTIQNRDTTVVPASVKLSINGTAVSPTVTPTADGATVHFALTTLPPAGVAQTASLSFKDNLGADVVSTWSFTLRYVSLDAAWRVKPGSERGMRVHLVQAPAGSNLENSLQRAELQLAPNSTIEKAIEATETVPAINFNKRAPSDDGYFPGDLLPPGLEPDSNGDADYAMEAFTYVELKAGIVRFGIRSDDGYKIASGAEPVTAATPALSFEANGTADRFFDVVVPADGVYPFRNVFYERAGASYFEWFVIDIKTGDKLLINDPDNAAAPKAYTSGTVLAVDKLLASSTAGGTYSDVEGAVLEQAATANSPGRITAPVPAGNQFYRLQVSAAARITSVAIQNGKLVFQYALGQ